LKEICATSNLVEQGHGTGAIIMKLHQQLGEWMLRAWSMVHSCRGMYSQSELDKTLDRYQKDIEKLCPNSIALRGINMFEQENKTRIHRELLAAGHSGASVSKHWMRFAQDAFKALPDHERARYGMMAAAATHERRAIAIGEAASLRNLSKLAMSRHADDIAKHGLTNHVSSCKFTTSDYDAMRAIYDSLDSSSMGRLADLKKSDAPAALPTDEVKQLEDLAAQVMRVVDVPIRMWLGRMCVFRASFEDTLLVAADAPDKGFVYLWASQQPRYALFLQVVREIVVLPDFENWTMEEIFNHRFGHRRHYKYVKPYAVVDDESIPLPIDGVGVSVFTNVIFDRTGVSCSDEPIALNAFTPILAKDDAPKKKANPKVPPEVDLSLLEKYPWLTQADIDLALGRRPKREKATHKGKKAPHDPGDASGDDDDDMSVSQESDDAPGEAGSDGGGTDDEMAALRTDYLADDDEMDFFALVIRGGHWTKKHKGVAGDSIQGHARGKFIQDWCKKYHYPASKSFYFSKYGHDEATRLAREFVRISNHFYFVWYTSGNPNYVFTVADHINDLDYITWVLTWPLGTDLQVRAMELQNLLPH
jgi:hypothetical protein